MPKRHLRITIGILLVLVAFSSYASPSDWQKPDYIFHAFKEIALKNEYQSTSSRILKWQRPIRYTFQYHQLPKNPLVEQLVNVHFKHLQAITHHAIQQTEQKPNLVVHLTTDANYAQVIQQHTPSRIANIDRESHCMGSFQTNKYGQIYRGQIVIPVDHAFSRGLLVSCIIEESTQLMGLPNDSDWVNPSIANDASKIEFLTGLDYVMLKILYSQSVSAGMSGKSLDQQLREVIAELRRNGEIQKAAKTVNQSGLYPLTN